MRAQVVLCRASCFRFRCRSCLPPPERRTRTGVSGDRDAPLRTQQARFGSAALRPGSVASFFGRLLHDQRGRGSGRVRASRGTGRDRLLIPTLDTRTRIPPSFNIRASRSGPGSVRTLERHATTDRLSHEPDALEDPEPTACVDRAGPRSPARGDIGPGATATAALASGPVIAPYEIRNRPFRISTLAVRALRPGRSHPGRLQVIPPSTASGPLINEATIRFREQPDREELQAAVEALPLR